jgi:hypothetical protein
MTEGILALSEAEFRVDFPVVFFAKHGLGNHGLLLNVDNIRVKSMSFLNCLR